MMRKKYTTLFYSVFFTLFTIILLTSCGSSNYSEEAPTEPVVETVEATPAPTEEETEENIELISVFITNANLNVREGAGTSYSVLYTAQKNDTLELTGNEETTSSGSIWYEVVVPEKETTGWVSGKYGTITEMDKDFIANGKNSELFTLSDEKINVQTGKYFKFCFIVNQVVEKSEIKIKTSDDTVAKVSKYSLTPSDDSTDGFCSIDGIKGGETTLHIVCKGKEAGQVSIPVSVIQPVVSKFENKSNSSRYSGEVGGEVRLSFQVSPDTVKEKDIKISISDSSVIKAVDKQLVDINGKKHYQFTIKTIHAGESTVKLVSSDGLTESSEISFNVIYVDHSNDVYITNYGKRYHRSRACAGDNAHAVSLETAKSIGLSPCGKCAQ